MLIGGIIMTPVGAEMIDIKLLKENVRSLNEKADWKLFSQDSRSEMEFYYDAKNITYPSEGSAIVPVKTVYKSRKGINELKRQRDRNRSTDSNGEPLKYDEFAFSVEWVQIYCSLQKIGLQEIAVDFDKRGNVLNLLPNATGVFPIFADTPFEKLYRIICSQEKYNKNNDVKNESPNISASSTAGTYRDQLSGMEFILVNGGCYDMGDTFRDGFDDEKPVHKVCISDFYIGKYEVTQDHWKSITGSEPLHLMACGGNCPVVFVSWNMTQEFIKKLNGKTNMNYRLPTEAEWEYAARSGGKKEKYAGTSIVSELDDYAWYEGTSKGQPHPVGQKRANGLGIYDMSGNVWEWVADWYTDSYNKSRTRENPIGPTTGEQRVVRGGNYQCSPQGIRATNRAGVKPSRRDDGTGFRLVLQRP